MSDSTRVFGETGASSEPDDASTAWLRVPVRCLIFVRRIRLTTGFACARVELKRVCGGRCAHGRAHGGLKSVEPRDHILSVLVGRRCCVAVGLDRERCGEIRIVKLANASIINVRSLYLLVGCTRDGPA
jgi:hypothetical protein